MQRHMRRSSIAPLAALALLTAAACTQGGHPAESVLWGSDEAASVVTGPQLGAPSLVKDLQATGTPSSSSSRAGAARAA